MRAGILSFFLFLEQLMSKNPQCNSHGSHEHHECSKGAIVRGQPYCFDHIGIFPGNVAISELVNFVALFLGVLLVAFLLEAAVDAVGEVEPSEEQVEEGLGDGVDEHEDRYVGG